jgi:hypothetical protein
MTNKKTMFFAACVVVCGGWNSLQAEEQTQVQKELAERVNIVKSRHEVLLKSVFVYNRLGNQNKNKLTSVIKMWDMQCSKIDTEISILSAKHDATEKTFFDDLEKRLTKKVVLLERFIDTLLSIRVKLEPISSCSLADYQRFLLPTYAVIVRDLSLQLRKKEIDEAFNWSNDTLTTLVRQVLTSKKVLGNSFWRLFSTDETTLYNNLAFDIKSFPESNGLWERYFSFLHEYMQTGYTTAIKSSCETVLDRFNNEMYGEGDPVLLSYITMITLKLCAIKNDLEMLASVQDLSTKKLYNIDLFMRYKTFLKKEIYYGQTFDIVVSDFYRIVGRYFNQHPTDFVFLFQVSTLLKQLRDAYQSQKSFFPWFFGTQDTILFEMISIVSSVEREIREVCCPESTTPGFAANIMNSSWWRSLAQASPLLVLTLFKYLAPHVQGAFDGKLSNFLTAQENNKQPDQDQLLTFIDKNPDLFKDIATKHPELLDIVAQRLQH